MILAVRATAKTTGCTAAEACGSSHAMRSLRCRAGLFGRRLLLIRVEQVETILFREAIILRSSSRIRNPGR